MHVWKLTVSKCCDGTDRIITILIYVTITMMNLTSDFSFKDDVRDVPTANYNHTLQKALAGAQTVRKQ